MPDNHTDALRSAARTLLAVAPQLPKAQELEGFGIAIAAAEARGHFDAVEDEGILQIFGRYLRVRAALADIISDLEPNLWDFDKIPRQERIEAFAITYTAACMLMRSAGRLVELYAENRLVHEKLDQGDPRFGIPRKQFTAIYRSRTDPLNYLRFDIGRRFAKAHMQEIRSLASDPTLEGVIDLLEREHAIAAEFSKVRSLAAGLRYRSHAWARRGRSSFKQVTFSLFELGGRSVSNLRNPLHRKAVTPDICKEVEGVLRPGDVLVTRHSDAATNLFLPGFWPHAALYVGSETQRESIGLRLPPGPRLRAADPARTLEALKDGVRFRPLATTLQVDSFAAIRPRVAPEDIAVALARAAEHEGKGYDFEFDFARSDRLVCTEVVYRGFHGIGGLDFGLTHRAGRPTLAAEDLLDMALDERGYEVVGLFGVHGSSLLQGEPARERLAASYRSA